MALSMDRWVGKVAVVTGASSGIGRAIAERLVDEGLKVAGLARRKDRLDDQAKRFSGRKGSFHPVVVDITKEEELVKAFEWIKKNLGPVHILINSAGIATLASLTADSSPKIWNDILQLNVMALSIATKEAIKSMEESSVNGHIIHVNSLAGHWYHDMDLGMYSASKHSVTVLTEYLRRELARKGSKIKITSLSPGLVDTEIIDEVLKEYGVLKNMYEQDMVLKPDDIVEGAIYVLSTPPRVQVHEITIRPTGAEI